MKRTAKMDEYERPTFWLYTGVDEAFYMTRVKIVLEQLPDDVSNIEILDIGCGDGRTTYELAKYAKRVVGIDPVERAIDFAKILGKRENVEYYVMDAENLDFFEDAQFDAVTCLEVIEHIPPENISITLKGLRRILKPRGVFIISTLNGARRKQPNPHHYNEYTIEEVKEIVKPYFEVEKVVGILLTIPIRRYSKLRNIVPFNLIFKWQIKSAKNHPKLAYDVVYKLEPR